MNQNERLFLFQRVCCKTYLIHKEFKELNGATMSRSPENMVLSWLDIAQWEYWGCRRMVRETNEQTNKQTAARQSLSILSILRDQL